MSWIEPVSTTIAATELAAKLAESSGFLRKNAARVLYSLRHGAAYLPIFGCGGAGKSTAARILGGADSLEVTAPYEESWKIEPIKLTGDIPGTILAAPGQLEKADRHWPELFRGLLKGRNIGILNVVSYGYHSLDIEKFEEHDAHVPGMNISEFCDAYTSERRNLELQFCQKLVNGLSALDRPLWVVTLVNKQDLWWKERLKVKQHYMDGNYSELISSLQRQLGVNRFQHEFVPASLTISNLVSASGQVIAETAGGYGMPNHISSLNIFLDQLNTLIDL